MKNVLLFENWGQKHDRFKNLNFDGLKYKNINEIKIGDRIVHVNNGVGTIVDIEDVGYTLKIKFDNSDDINFYLSNILINGDYIRKIENDKMSSDVKSEEIEIEEEEEEEEDDDDYLDDLTEEDLADINISDFFNDVEITFLVSIDDINEYKEKIKLLLNSKFNPVKDKINKKRFNQIEILEKYFKYLNSKYPYKKVYKFNGQIPYDELWDIRKKYKIENKIDDLDNYIKTVFIYYWIFKDSIVFKTI